MNAFYFAIKFLFLTIIGLCFSSTEMNHSSTIDFNRLNADNSSITSIPQDISDFSCTGLEDIVAVGQINGKPIAQSSSKYHLQFNEIEKTYSINIYLKKGDFVCFFMKQRGSYIYGFQSDSYSESMIKSVGFGKYTTSGRQHFLVNYEGRYDFIISGNVENLSFPTDTWKLNGGSYIKFYGDDISYCYLMASNITSNYSHVFSEAKYSTIQQFGPFGMDIKNINCFKVDDQSILRIPFDQKYTDSVTIDIEINNESFKFEIQLTPSCAYYFDNLIQPNNIAGSACDYLSVVFDSTSQLFLDSVNIELFKNLSSDECDKIQDMYVNLEDAKDMVDNARVICLQEDEMSEVDYLSLHSKIIQNLDRRSQPLLFICYFSIGLVICAVFAFFLLSLKRQANSFNHL